MEPNPHGRGSTLRLVPAPSGRRRRWLVEPDPTLAASLLEAVAAVAGRIEEALGPEVVANRVCRLDPLTPSLRLEPWGRARARLHAEIARRSRGAGALLLSDVRACYRSISPRTVTASLGRLGCPVHEVRAVARVLREFTALGVSGLPVGPEPSAVLANAVLIPVDDALRRAGLTHLRWVDDFWIFLRSPAGASQAFRRLRGALEGAGLQPAPEKTRLLVGSEVPTACGAWTCLSGPAPRYHRRSDAHPVPGIHGPHALPSSDRDVAAGGRSPR